MDFEDFRKAKPIWPRGFLNEMNMTVGLYTSVQLQGKEPFLKIASSGPYRVFVNGVFIANGPARCGKGCFRIDTIALPCAPVCHVAIEVVNYAINSFEWLDQDGFVQAEIIDEKGIIAATGVEGFTGFRLTERVQKVPRFSYQRPFSEAYRMDASVHAWRMGIPGKNAIPIVFEETEEKNLMPRKIAPYTYPIAAPAFSLGKGTFSYPVVPEKLKRDRSLMINKVEYGSLKGYPEEELEWNTYADAQMLRCDQPIEEKKPFTGTVRLSNGQYEVLQMPCEKTGYLACHIHCEKPTTLWFFVDERMTQEGLVDPLAMKCLNAIPLQMEAGDYDFQAVEALGFLYMQVLSVGGDLLITDLHLIEAVCPYPITAEYCDPDKKRQAIFSAACENFRQNAVDIFMDCPTRERAGWLCDSWFTARAEKKLTGGNSIERNMLENFAVAVDFPCIPDGMVPMCYPSDHNSGQFIPNWAMWFVLEVEDYLRRTGDAALVALLKNRLEGIAQYFEKFENEDGLLEKLESWVFLEWSHANDLVQDINFPTNMLYALMLDAMADLYSNPNYRKKSEHLREVIRQHSFNGTFFTDNEVYQNGKPVSTGEVTETCQYYAFFTGIATPETYPALWHTLCTEFGPQRTEKGFYPSVAPSNAFIGNFLRLEMLRQNGLWNQLLEEVEGYFWYMAERTGTLWENITDSASCNHGFASYAAVFLLEAEQQHCRPQIQKP